MIEDKLQADEALERIAEYEAQVQAAQDECRAFCERYECKIAEAKKICEDKIADVRRKIEFVTEDLRRFAECNLDDGKRSIRLPSGTIGFRKQSPRYFFDGLKEAHAKSEPLIHFVKHNAHEYLKVKVEEYVDWAQFKTKLETDGTNVFYTGTGEIVEGLRVQILPDKFTVKTN